MNFFKKIDQYLLHHLPSVWITRVHIFLPIGLAAIALIHLINLAIGWNPKNDLPRSENMIILMIVPILVYLVYWFIFQSRYNVSKSGRKMNLLEEYVNLILYAVVLFVAYLFILLAPISNDKKIMYSVPKSEFQVDLEKLDRGNAIVNEGSLQELSSGKFRVEQDDFIDHFWYHEYTYTNDYEPAEPEILTRREVLMRIADYIEVYNKYNYYETSKSPEEILADRLNPPLYDDDEYYYNDLGDFNSWDFERKISRLDELHSEDLTYGRYYIFWYDHIFWKVSLAIIFWIALVIWMFKQMNLRHFIYGLISLCLTPLAAGIVGMIVFGLLQNSYSSYRSSEGILLWLTAIIYAFLLVVMVRGFAKNKLSQTAYVITMYVHFWLPWLPIFIFLFMDYYRSTNYYFGFYYGSYDLIFELIYWSSVFLGFASVALFKPIYSKFRNLPMQK